ncbi:cupin domain-containing protein, partial [Streptomyces sp. NPDC005093]
FVVVSGRATVAVEDGATLQIGPGDACVLREGTAARQAFPPRPAGSTLP